MQIKNKQNHISRKTNSITCDNLSAVYRDLVLYIEESGVLCDTYKTLCNVKLTINSPQKRCLGGFNADFNIFHAFGHSINTISNIDAFIESSNLFIFQTKDKLNLSVNLDCCNVIEQLPLYAFTYSILLEYLAYNRNCEIGTLNFNICELTLGENENKLTQVGKFIKEFDFYSTFDYRDKFSLGYFNEILMVNFRDLFDLYSKSENAFTAAQCIYTNYDAREWVNVRFQTDNKAPFNDQYFIVALNYYLRRIELNKKSVDYAQRIEFIKEVKSKIPYIGYL